MSPEAMIDGCDTVDLCRCTVRFVQIPPEQAGREGAYRPVLYWDGKRVTEAWSLVINHSEPQDPYGRSA